MVEKARSAVPRGRGRFGFAATASLPGTAHFHAHSHFIGFRASGAQVVRHLRLHAPHLQGISQQAQHFSASGHSLGSQRTAGGQQGSRGRGAGRVVPHLARAHLARAPVCISAAVALTRSSGFFCACSRNLAPRFTARVRHALLSRWFPQRAPKRACPSLRWGQLLCIIGGAKPANAKQLQGRGIYSISSSGGEEGKGNTPLRQQPTFLFPLPLWRQLHKKGLLRGVLYSVLRTPQSTPRGGYVVCCFCPKEKQREQKRNIVMSHVLSSVVFLSKKILENTMLFQFSV